MNKLDKKSTAPQDGNGSNENFNKFYDYHCNEHNSARFSLNKLNFTSDLT